MPHSTEAWPRQQRELFDYQRRARRAYIHSSAGYTKAKSAALYVQKSSGFWEISLGAQSSATKSCASLLGCMAIQARMEGDGSAPGAWTSSMRRLPKPLALCYLLVTSFEPVAHSAPEPSETKPNSLRMELTRRTGEN